MEVEESRIKATLIMYREGRTATAIKARTGLNINVVAMAAGIADRQERAAARVGAASMQRKQFLKWDKLIHEPYVEYRRTHPKQVPPNGQSCIT